MGNINNPNNLKVGDKILVFRLPYWNGVVVPHEQKVLNVTKGMVKVFSNGIFPKGVWIYKNQVEKIN